jgi:AhpD family alkylhydroperoxidase
MAWLTIPGDTETPELEQLTLPWRTRGEQVPPVMAVLKGRPRAFRAVLELNYALSFGASSLGRWREELIAVWVSALNQCFFCLSTHARYLEQASGEGDALTLIRGLSELALAVPLQHSGALAALESGLRLLPGLGAEDRALLLFCAEISAAPPASSQAGTGALRALGFSEPEVLDAVLVASCFSFMNRLACATGVTLDVSKHAAAERMFGRAALEQHLAWAQAATPQAR